MWLFVNNPHKQYVMNPSPRCLPWHRPESGEAYQKLCYWQWLESGSRCGLSKVVSGSLVALPLAPNPAVVRPAEQRGFVDGPCKFVLWGFKL